MTSRSDQGIVNNEVSVLGTPKSILAQCASLGLRVFLIEGRGGRYTLGCWPKGSALPVPLRSLVAKHEEELVAYLREGKQGHA